MLSKQPNTNSSVTWTSETHLVCKSSLALTYSCTLRIRNESNQCWERKKKKNHIHARAKRQAYQKAKRDDKSQRRKARSVAGSFFSQLQQKANYKASARSFFYVRCFAHCAHIQGSKKAQLLYYKIEKRKKGNKEERERIKRQRIRNNRFDLEMLLVRVELSVANLLLLALSIGRASDFWIKAVPPISQDALDTLVFVLKDDDFRDYCAENTTENLRLG